MAIIGMTGLYGKVRTRYTALSMVRASASHGDGRKTYAGFQMRYIMRMQSVYAPASKGSRETPSYTCTETHFVAWNGFSVCYVCNSVAKRACDAGTRVRE